MKTILKNTTINIANQFCSIALTAFCLLPIAGNNTAFAHEDLDNAELIHQIAHMFEDEALVGEPVIVDCKLSGGTQTKCFAVTVVGNPTNHKMGPWCPTNISDNKEKGGIWFEDGKSHDVDGNFIKNLDVFYDDPKWSMFDKINGKINVTNSKEACSAAARPDVDPKYNNYCVECETDYIEGSTEHTYIIPIHPADTWWSKSINPFTGIGVALNGVRIDGSAPTDAILSAHTLAPFDDCGGHVNLHVGYHYHAITDCLPKANTTQNHAPVIGFAMDGYRIHTHLDKNGNKPDDLDRCGGHETAELGYHYHAAERGKNAIISCYRGETGCSNAGNNTECDATKMPPPPRPSSHVDE